MAAPLAVLVGALAPGLWPVLPLAVLALLALIVMDGALAGGLANADLTFAHDTEIGRPTILSLDVKLARSSTAGLSAALAFDPRLGSGGRADLQLEPAATSGRWQGDFTLKPNRRGSGAIETLWLRWNGPLGLAARVNRIDQDAELRVWPDLSPVRSPALQTILRDARSGLLTRRVRGEGTQFEALSDYAPGMDRRRIDWKASARHTSLYARENEAERDNQIVFAYDCGQSMCEPVDGLPRIDRAVSAGLASAYVALKGGDRIGLFAFADKPEIAIPFFGEARQFDRVQQAAAAIDYHAVEPNFTLALAALSARLKRRSLIILFSDFTDLTSAELMIESLGRLVKHHLVIFVTMKDSEIADMRNLDGNSLEEVAQAVTADRLARQRALVLERLRRLGVDVVDAPWDQIGFQLIDRYLEKRRAEAIG
ncbi:DUF58 domain-containing protein [Altererythrobacter endophyticus]|uniref:DUF58 domain-containing protein n=2 Tax=Altericroceibacterium endophyticum TaxID=1808508 RepID=A0A6I4T4D7_9SPHN|nr:DUF58 domain-containing protein [Altericroceibacterium endophyticum]